MRRLGYPVSADFEILVWGQAVEGSVRMMMVVEVLESVDVFGDFADLGREVDGCVELVAPCAIASLDGAVELWRPWRQDTEGMLLS